MSREFAFRLQRSNLIWILFGRFVFWTLQSTRCSCPWILNFAFIYTIWFSSNFTVLGPQILLHTRLAAVISNYFLLFSPFTHPREKATVFFVKSDLMESLWQPQRRFRSTHTATEQTVQAPHLPLLLLFPVQLELSFFFPLSQPHAKPPIFLPGFLQ